MEQPRKVSGHRGSCRLMTSGDDSLQAVMHQVPFSAKHVMGALPPRISGIFTDYFHHFFFTSLSLVDPKLDLEARRRTEESGQGLQGRGFGRGRFLRKHDFSGRPAPVTSVTLVTQTHQPHDFGHSSSTNQLLRFQRYRCLSALASDARVAMATHVTHIVQERL